MNFIIAVFALAGACVVLKLITKDALRKVLREREHDQELNMSRYMRHLRSIKRMLNQIVTLSSAEEMILHLESTTGLLLDFGTDYVNALLAMSDNGHRWTALGQESIAEDFSGAIVQVERILGSKNSDAYVEDIPVELLTNIDKIRSLVDRLEACQRSVKLITSIHKKSVVSR